VSRVLVDSHCHLDFPALAEDIPGVLERARAAGVQVVQTIATRLDSAARVLALAEAHPGVYCALGVHPHHAAQDRVEDARPLLAHVGHPRVIGIGESGLDYYYEHSPKEVQAQVFRAHIDAARRSGLPLVVHTRDADGDTVRILEEAMAVGPFTGVIHCYSSSPELAFRALDLGLYLGIGGMLTFKRSEALRATVRELPLERLLLETDAPYLAPEPFRGKRNEPAYVAHVAARLAEIRGLPVAAIERATSANFFRLFAKAQPPAISS
jgi:TatD DNase family protein